MGKKIDYGRASEQPRPLGSGGVQYLGDVPVQPETDYTRMVRRSHGMDRTVITTIAGCVFLLGGFVALFFCLKALWEGVFGDLAWEKALAGFAGSVLVTYLCAWAGWRFLFKPNG